MEPSAALKGQIIELRERFLRKMPARIEAIASTLTACIDGGSDAMDRLERQFHTLAGTAGDQLRFALAAESGASPA